MPMIVMITPLTITSPAIDESSADLPRPEFEPNCGGAWRRTA
jgi:hypothetical protein